MPIARKKKRKRQNEPGTKVDTEKFDRAEPTDSNYVQRI